MNNNLEARVKAIEEKLGITPKEVRYIRASKPLGEFLSLLYAKAGLPMQVREWGNEFVIGGIAVQVSPFKGGSDYLIVYTDGTYEEGSFMLGATE